MMATITTCQGLEIKVDDDLLDDLTRFKWFVNERGYAFRAVRNERGGRQSLRMHRYVLGLEIGGGQEVDHINGDKLDNRRANLRISTRSENCHRKAKTRRNSSGFKGVHWHSTKRIWAGQITYCGKKKHLGYFETAEMAHEFYCLAADMIHGDRAHYGGSHA